MNPCSQVGNHDRISSIFWEPRMILVGKQILAPLLERSGDARQRVLLWILDVETAKWKSIDDVRTLYPQVISLTPRSAGFNFPAYKIGIGTSISFRNAIVVVNNIENEI